MYQIWLTEREKYIKQLKENGALLDMNTKLLEDKIYLEEKLEIVKTLKKKKEKEVNKLNV